MKDSEGNELHVGDTILFRRPYSKKWMRCTVREIGPHPFKTGVEDMRLDDGDPLSGDLSTNGFHMAHMTDEPKRLKKVQQAVDPHATVTMISLHDGNKEGL